MSVLKSKSQMKITNHHELNQANYPISKGFNGKNAVRYVVSKHGDNFRLKSTINLPSKLGPLGIPMLIEPCLEVGDRGLVNLPSIPFWRSLNVFYRWGT